MLKIIQKTIKSRYGTLVKITVSVGTSRLVQVKRIGDMERSISLKSRSTEDGGISTFTFPLSLGIKYPEKIKEIVANEIARAIRKAQGAVD